MPEFSEARTLYHQATDPLGALRPLERVTDVMQHVPMQAMRVVASGAMAQAMRGAGLLTREAQLWEALRASPLDDEMHQHILCSAITCALHQSDVESAKTMCAEGASLSASLPDPRRWESTFEVLRALALSSEPSAAAAHLEKLLLKPSDRDDSSLAAAQSSARLLLGDRLVSLDRAEEACELWQRVVQEVRRSRE